jgi:hypothetical protein
MRQPAVSGPISNKALEGFPIPFSLQESRASRGTAEDLNHARLAKESTHQVVSVVFRPDGTCLRKQRGSF